MRYTHFRVYLETKTGMKFDKEILAFTPQEARWVAWYETGRVYDVDKMTVETVKEDKAA